MINRFTNVRAMTRRAFTHNYGPRHAITIRDSVYRRLSFFTFFTILRRLLTFPINEIRRTSSILNNCRRIILMEHSVTSSIKERNLQVAYFRTMIYRSPQTCIRSIRSTRVNSCPSSIFKNVVVRDLSIIVKGAIKASFQTRPFRLANATIMVIRSTPFNTGPRVTILIFSNTTCGQVTRPLLFSKQVRVTTMCLMLKIRMISTTGMNPRPRHSLIILCSTPSKEIYRSITLNVANDIILRRSHAFIVPIRSIRYPGPSISRVIFATNSRRIKESTMEILYIMFGSFSNSINLCVIRPFFPTTGPWLTFTILMCTNSITFRSKINRLILIRLRTMYSINNHSGPRLSFIRVRATSFRAFSKGLMVRIGIPNLLIVTMSFVLFSSRGNLFMVCTIRVSLRRNNRSLNNRVRLNCSFHARRMSFSIAITNRTRRNITRGTMEIILLRLMDLCIFSIVAIRTFSNSGPWSAIFVSMGTIRKRL